MVLMRLRPAGLYFTDQVIDMMAPTNFLGTNPEALEKAETQGQSLIDGLENPIRTWRQTR